MPAAVYALEPAHREYAWGSPTAIPGLLGIEPNGRPLAELWFGAHRDDPARCPAERADLGGLIATDPVGLLGPDVAARFDGNLPFLLKVLAANRPLSIQVHPSLEQARSGFAAEQARGVAMDAPDRNYRDANHKPELLCALTEFDALCGLRPVADTLELLTVLDVPELDPLRAALTGSHALRAGFELLLEIAPDHRGSFIEAVLAGCRRHDTRPGPWALAARACITAASHYPGDIGAVITLLLNAVRLQPGEAIYLGAGNIHAYLHGMGVEIMANSDNVLRCGLTPKRVDVAEVLRIADFAPLPEPRRIPRVIDVHEQVFEVPVPDFELSVLELDAEPDVELDATAPGPQILLCTAGSLHLRAATAGSGRGLELGRGHAAFVAAGTPVRVAGNATAFRASMPRA
jgi:mannose-6-phosphate isomerase